MTNTKSLMLYEDGLTTLLDVCEECFGPNGSPIYVKCFDRGHIKSTKNSMEILKSIDLYSTNPLVKVTLNFALNQSKDNLDHTFYLIILGVNIYLKLKQQKICHSASLDTLDAIENLIVKHMAEQSRFHRSFESHFDFLVQLSVSIVKPKLFGYLPSKLEAFCRFIVTALLQSIPDKNLITFDTWFEPSVLTLPTVCVDPYKYGEIFEGILFPIIVKSKLKSYLQRVIELRSFTTYELLYKEKRNLNSVLMIYDSSKICESLQEQMVINEKNCLPSLKQTVTDVLEGEFIDLLEKSNIGLIIVQNEMSGNLKSKLSDRSIFILDGIDQNLISRTSRIFNVEIVTSLKIEDTESFVFKVEIPILKNYRRNPYLAISKPGIITVIFYKLLDNNYDTNEQLAKLLFKHLGKMILSTSQFSQTNLCHGAGCTEYLLAGIILRADQMDKFDTNFMIPKANYNHSLIQSAIAESFIRIYKLTRDVNKPQNCNQVDDLFVNCQNNFNCICAQSRQRDFHDNNVSDFTSAKMAAIRNGLRLVSALMNIDLVILTTD